MPLLMRIAFRAKQRRFDDFDGLLEESTIKPIQRSIIEQVMNKTNQICFLANFVKRPKRWGLFRDFKRQILFLN